MVYNKIHECYCPQFVPGSLVCHVLTVLVLVMAWQRIVRKTQYCYDIQRVVICDCVAN